MKLFYKTGTCSLAPHIVLTELGFEYELELVDLAKKTSVSGDYNRINPKGSVPALLLDNGEVLTEVAVINQYLSDSEPDSQLMPKLGSLDRYRCLEWLNFIASEVHKSFGPLFWADRLMKTEESKTELKSITFETLAKKMEFISQKLGRKDYLLGSQFSVADAYLFTVMGWSKYVNLDLSKWANLEEYMKRVAARPAVIRAMKESGQIK